MPQGFVLDLVGYTDQDSIRREEIIIEQLAKVGLKAQFSNGSIAEMSAAFFGKDKKGAGLLSAWTGRPDPSLTTRSCIRKIPTSTRRAPTCRLNCRTR